MFTGDFRGPGGGWGRSPCFGGGEEVENFVSVGGFCLGGGLMVGSVVAVSVISEVWKEFERERLNELLGTVTGP